MKRQLYILSFLFFVNHICFGQSLFINPTGTYKLNSKAKVKDGDTYGNFGEIRVKLLDSNSIVMSFFTCKGAPSYNSGSFIDTLTYDNNSCTFRDKEDTAKACKVVFTFTQKQIDLNETANYEYGTCWGHGVFAYGSFRKTGTKTPVIKNPFMDD
jgi:hypothetical protein